MRANNVLFFDEERKKEGRERNRNKEWESERGEEWADNRIATMVGVRQKSIREHSFQLDKHLAN